MAIFVQQSSKCISSSCILAKLGVPEFTEEREASPKHNIHCCIHASQVDGQWASLVLWTCLSDESLADDTSDSVSETLRQTLSESIDAALDIALRQVRAQLALRKPKKAWGKDIDAFARWVKDTVIRVRDKERESLPMYGLTHIDLFSGGAGGFSVVFDRMGASRLLACEIDPAASEAFVANHGGEIHDDIRTLSLKGKVVDIMTAGVPCITLSKAGNQRGLSDELWADLVGHIYRLIEESTPRIVFIENAPELLTHDRGRTSAAIRFELIKRGYRVQGAILNACDFGLPQNRKRAYLVATRHDCKLDPLTGFQFPIGDALGAVVADILEAGVPGEIAMSRVKAQTAFPSTRTPALVRVGLIDDRNSQGYRVYHSLGLGPTLTASSGGACSQTGAILTPDGVRRLTPRETYRMQGMPEWSTPHKNPRVARRHAGNGVAVPVVAAIARGFGKLLTQQAAAS